MNLSKLLIIIVALLIILLVACEPDSGPVIDVTKDTKGLCFFDSGCQTTATQPIGIVGHGDKTSTSKCCSLDPQAKVSFCPEGKIKVRSSALIGGNKGYYAGCDQCIEIDCATRTMTGDGVVQPVAPKPIIPQPPQPPVIPSPSVTQTSDEEVIDYYCCVVPGDVFYPGPPYFKKMLDLKGNPRKCSPSYDTEEEATAGCIPKVAQIGFKVNDVNIRTDCEIGYTIAYVSLSDPEKDVASIDLMYKTPEQKSWIGIRGGLFYDPESNQYYNSVKLAPGNYQYQVSVKTKTNTLIISKEGAFNVPQCPKNLA